MEEQAKKETGEKKKEVAGEMQEKESKKKEAEKKIEDKKQEKTEEKKDKAAVNAKNLAVSTKQSMAICSFIKGKDIERAMDELQRVIEKKIAIPMKGELPHRPGMERGRYPENACKIFIKLLKGLSANSSVNGLEEPYISFARADVASRPYRRFGSARFKRTNVYLEAREGKGKKENKEEKKKG